MRGRLIGVLDLTTLARPFGFDAGQMVGIYATTIENALLQAQSHEHLILGFQVSPALLDTPLQGLAGIATDGTVAWLNDAGSRLVGRLPPSDGGRRDVESLFGHDLGHLLRLSRSQAPQYLRLANGLRAWMQARLQAPDGLGSVSRPPSLAAPTRRHRRRPPRRPIRRPPPTRAPPPSRRLRPASRCASTAAS